MSRRTPSSPRSSVDSSYDSGQSHYTVTDKLEGADRDLPDFEVAVLVQEDVARFQVAMDDIGGVQEFEGTEDLVDEVLDVLGQKLLSGANHSAQISLHKFTNEVDVTKNFPKRRKKMVRHKPSDLPLLGNVDDVKET